jgi:hypothetical protein
MLNRITRHDLYEIAIASKHAPNKEMIALMREFAGDKATASNDDIEAFDLQLDTMEGFINEDDDGVDDRRVDNHF